MEAKGTTITWALFQERFLEKYFPEDVREKKEMEFLALTQGSMTVGEYVAKFKELSRYHPHYHNALDERLRCVKFTNGLRLEIKEVIRMQEICHFPTLLICHFPTLLNRCRIFEEDHKEKVARVKNYRPQRPQKKGFERKKPYHHSQHCQESSSRSAKKPAVTGDTNTSATTLKCFECEGPHLKRDCLKKTRSVTYFTCGQQGHYAKDCPEVKKEKNGNGGSDDMASFFQILSSEDAVVYSSSLWQLSLCGLPRRFCSDSTE